MFLLQFIVYILSIITNDWYLVFSTVLVHCISAIEFAFLHWFLQCTNDMNGIFNAIIHTVLVHQHGELTTLK